MQVCWSDLGYDEDVTSSRKSTKPLRFVCVCVYIYIYIDTEFDDRTGPGRII